MHLLHIALHFLVPIVIGMMTYGARRYQATLLLIATLFVDLDHLLATPVYDPNRCSINFHPLHSTPALVLYAASFATPLLLGGSQGAAGMRKGAWVVHVAGLGLLVHMALDWSECLRLGTSGR